ncbi:MAG TPA: phosphomannomutase/phosphoglucomutase [Phycisphaerae bacterium]|nr:phosphomannomutase/phosphoglucomutase [Phycisphaerae bacterium]
MPLIAAQAWSADRTGMQEVSEYYRHCPDQPKVLISDAVCLGRRRNRYPQCPGCRFNDEERSAAAGGPRPLTAHAASDVEQVFVNDGVRATYPDHLDEELAWRIGHASASYLRGALRGLDRSDPVATTVVVGRDTRGSSPALCAALVEGARSTGAAVVDIGVVDTPQLYFAINHFRSCGGVQTTGSGRAAPYNGFKIAGQGGRPVAAETGLMDVERIAANMIKHDTGQEGALRTQDLTNEYRAFVRGHLLSPRPMKVVVDASNGTGGKWVPRIFDDLTDVELICLNSEHDTEFAHVPDPLGEGCLDPLKKEVVRRGADFGVCFDGDADRVVAVDEAGEAVEPDLLTALLARPLLARAAGSTIVYDLRSSRVVAEEIKAAGGVPRRERVGYAYMRKALAESKGVFGGELCGRYYFKENFYCESGVLVFVHLINMLTSERRGLVELVRPLKRYTRSGRRTFESSDANAVLRRLAEAYAGARVDFLDGLTVQYEDWWFNVRPADDQAALCLNLEATTPELMQEKVDEVSGHLASLVTP